MRRRSIQGSRSVFTPLLPFVAAATTAAQTAPAELPAEGPPGLPAEIGELVPDDAFALIVARSLEGLDAAPDALLQALGLEVPEEGFARGLLFEHLPEARDELDPTRPLGLALSPPEERGGAPTATLVLPAQRPATLIARLEMPAALAPPALAGGWIGVPLRATYPQGAEEPPPCAADLHASGAAEADLWARVDLLGVERAYRRDLEASLALARALDGAPRGPAAWGDVALGLFDEAEALELAASWSGGTVELQAALHVTAGSRLDGEAIPDPSLVGGLPADVDLALVAPLELLRAADELAAPLLDSSLRGPVRAALADGLARMAELGDEVALGVGRSDRGLELTYLFAPDDPAAAAAAWRRELEGRVLVTPGLEVGGPIEMVTDGLAVASWRIEPSPGAAPALRGVLERTFGEGGLRLAVAHGDGRLALAVGGSSVVPRAHDAVSSAPRDSIAVDGDSLRARLSADVDLLRPLLSALLPQGAPPLPPATLSAGVRGRVWFVRLRVDPADER